MWISENEIRWNESLENWNKIKDFWKRKSVQAALFLALTGAWTFATYQIFKDKDSAQIEQVKDLKWYPFEHHHLAFWDDNPDFFAKNLAIKKEMLAPGVVIKRDAGLTFYIIQEEDIKEVAHTIFISKKTKVKQWHKFVYKYSQVPHTTVTHVADFEKMRKKLSAISEFSYLKDDEYDRSSPNNKTKSFNIPKESAKAGMLIPVPLDHEVREISPEDFSNYCHDAIKDLVSSHSTYAPIINKLMAHVSEKDIITAMLAFARSETASEYTNFVQPLGEVELHRREPAFKAFSFTYFHILMERNSDGKTAGPGLAARLKLWLTEWQCYHPKNAAKLFIAYWIEKTHGHLENIFPLTSSNIKQVWTKYNGSSSYADKLLPNYLYSKKLLAGEVTHYDNTMLKQTGFVYTWLNSHYEHMYKVKTPKWIHSIDKLKSFIVEEFNNHKAADCPAIDENDVLNREKKTLSWQIIPDTVFIKVPKK